MFKVDLMEVIVSNSCRIGWGHVAKNWLRTGVSYLFQRDRRPIRQSIFIARFGSRDGFLLLSFTEQHHEGTNDLQEYYDYYYYFYCLKSGFIRIANLREPILINTAFCKQ